MPRFAIPQGRAAQDSSNEVDNRAGGNLKRFTHATRGGPAEDTTEFWKLVEKQAREHVDVGTVEGTLPAELKEKVDKALREGEQKRETGWVSRRKQRKLAARGGPAAAERERRGPEAVEAFKREQRKLTKEMRAKVTWTDFVQK